jgi:DNA-directed RNA polymerase specialized sigma24 family protein
MLRKTTRAARDEEDIALSAFESFFAAATRGRIPRLDNRDDLWRILVTITRRKALDEAQHQHRLKRGGPAECGPSRDKAVGDAGNLDLVVCPEPTPEFVAVVADECRKLLASLADDRLRQIALLKMEGYTNEEIAGQLGCGLRSVVRKLDLIRRTWLAESSD